MFLFGFKTLSLPLLRFSPDTDKTVKLLTAIVPETRKAAVRNTVCAFFSRMVMLAAPSRVSRDLSRSYFSRWIVFYRGFH